MYCRALSIVSLESFRVGVSASLVMGEWWRCDSYDCLFSVWKIVRLAGFSEFPLLLINMCGMFGVVTRSTGLPL